MRYFKIDPLGDDQDKGLAMIGAPPQGIGLYDYCMARGERVGERYPIDAKIYLEAKQPGIKLPSLLGNTLNYLIVCTDMKDVVVQHCGDELEVLSFTLYNHKKRVHSKDYWIMNPTGSVDCVDEGASEIKYFDNKGKLEVVSVKRYVFDRERAARAPGLFRVPQNLSDYFINLPLARVLQQRGFTNIFLEEIKVGG